MRFFRADRVSSVIREELGKLLIRELEFGGAVVTITEVEVQKKLDIATVYVSVFPSEKAPEIMRVLGEATPRLQHLLLRKMNIKPMPQIEFRHDIGPERAAAIEKALLKGHNDQGTRD